MDDALMTVINPVAITEGMYVSANVLEDDYPEWSAATSYSAGTYVIRATQHKIYRSITNTNLNNIPELTTKVQDPVTPKWQEVVATNKWAAFDGKVGSKTVATDILELVINPGTTGSLAVLNMTGALLEIEMTNGVGGPVVYTHSKVLIEPCAPDWESYFFDELVQIADYVLLDLPRINTGVIKVRVTGNGIVGIGALVAGTKTYLGTTQWGVALSFKNYSVKSTDEFGNTTLIPRDIVSKMEGRAEILSEELDRVQSKYKSMQSKPLVWIAANNLYRSLIIYGFCENISTDLQYSTHSMCSFSIEGIV